MQLSSQSVRPESKTPVICSLENSSGLSGYFLPRILITKFTGFVMCVILISCFNVNFFFFPVLLAYQHTTKLKHRGEAALHESCDSTTNTIYILQTQMLKMGYFGAVGRARACHARGHGFESEHGRTFLQGIIIPLKCRFLTPGKKGQADPNTVAIATVIMNGICKDLKTAQLIQTIIIAKIGKQRRQREQAAK